MTDEQTETPQEQARKLLGLPRTVPVAGMDVVVRPYLWPELFDVITACWPIVDLLASGKPGTILHAIAANRPAIDRLVEISTGVGAEQMKTLSLSDGLMLASAVWAENSDFFVRELTPVIVKALGSKTAKSSSPEAPSSSPAPTPPPTPSADGSDSPTS